MGKVAVVAKVFPESMEVFEALKSSIQNEMKPYSIVEEEIALGMKALKVTVVLADASMGSDVEERLKKIKGVSEVQIDEVGLI